MGNGVLAGLRVVDFGQYVAGPLTALLLADQGADVVHVDPPGGPRLTGHADAALNRGKRRVELDLTDPGDLAFAHRLIEASDVLVENFRPGTAERLGIGWEETARRNPALVYCALPGFAADDPRAHLPGWEGLIAAATGNCRPREGEAPPGWDLTRPTYSPIPAASTMAASLAAYGVVAALAVRHRTGDAFEGLKVVDLTQILAGPTSGRLLADLGAEVYKINAPQRRVAAHAYVNRGKRSVLLDIDYGGGVLAAFAAALGVYGLLTTGAASRVTASLSGTGPRLLADLGRAEDVEELEEAWVLQVRLPGALWP